MNKRIPKQCSTLIEVLRWRALHQSERQAYTFLTDEEQKELHLTYEELDRRARAIATFLQIRGKMGARALLLHPPGLDYITAYVTVSLCIKGLTVSVGGHHAGLRKGVNSGDRIRFTPPARARLHSPFRQALASIMNRYQ